MTLGRIVDFDDYSLESLMVDPYYQEFLRSYGYFWHANATIAQEEGDSVDLSLKRRVTAGPYEPDDVAQLNTVLPDLRLAARLARRVFNSRAAGMVELLHHRGDPVFELDSWGRVVRDHAFDESRAGPVRVAGRRLAVVDARTQRALDRAVADATGDSGRVGSVALPGDGRERYALQIIARGSGATSL